MGFETLMFCTPEELKTSKREDVVTDDRRTLLIEVNDGYALGVYGLFNLDYANLMSAKWAEFANTKDECAFNANKKCHLKYCDYII